MWITGGMLVAELLNLASRIARPQFQTGRSGHAVPSGVLEWPQVDEGIQGIHKSLMGCHLKSARRPENNRGHAPPGRPIGDAEF